MCTADKKIQPKSETEEIDKPSCPRYKINLNIDGSACGSKIIKI